MRNLPIDPYTGVHAVHDLQILRDADDKPFIAYRYAGLMRYTLPGYLPDFPITEAAIHGRRFAFVAGRYFRAANLAKCLIRKDPELLAPEHWSGWSDLTAREQETYGYLARGLRQREIADRLGLSVPRINQLAQALDKKGFPIDIRAMRSFQNILEVAKHKDLTERLDEVALAPDDQSFVMRLLDRARDTAVREGKRFVLDPRFFLPLPSRCPVSGRALHITHNPPALVRIERAGDFDVENVRVVSESVAGLFDHNLHDLNSAMDIMRTKRRHYVELDFN